MFENKGGNFGLSGISETNLLELKHHVTFWSTLKSGDFRLTHFASKQEQAMGIRNQLCLQYLDNKIEMWLKFLLLSQSGTF